MVLGVPNPVGFAFDWLMVGLGYKLLGFGATAEQVGEINIFDSPLTTLRNVLMLPLTSIYDFAVVTVLTVIFRRVM